MDVQIVISATTLIVTPNEVAELLVEVHNHREIRLESMLQARGIDASWISFRPPVLSVDAGQTGRSTLVIQPPEDAAAGSRELTIRATSRDTGQELASATVRVTVPAADGAIESEQISDASDSASQTNSANEESGSARRPLLIAGAISLLAIVILAGVILARSGTEIVLPDDNGEAAAAGATEVELGELAKTCTDMSAQIVSLMTDDATTAILMSDADLKQLRILRTEPAYRLPGLYESLLALSGEGDRLAYVMADNPAMDETRIMFFDVDQPGDVHEVLHLPSGFWPIRPAWSPDNALLAFASANTESASQKVLQLDIWISDLNGNQQSLGAVAVGEDTLEQIDHSIPLCWSEDGATVIFNKLTSQIEFSVESATERLVARESANDSAGGPVATGTGCGVPVFSQNEPAWRHHVMQTWGDTIGDFGCALTSAAMVSNYYGAPVDPASLNQCLGPYAELLHWNQVPACASGHTSFVDRADFTWDRLDQVLAQGNPAIVGMVRGQTGMHFVVVTAGGGGIGANYAVTDPWDGSTSKTLQSFTNAGYNPAWVVEYSGSSEGSCDRVAASVDTPIKEGVDGSIHKEPVDVGEMVEDDDDAVVVQVWPPVMVQATEDDDEIPDHPFGPDGVDGFVQPSGSQVFVEVLDVELSPQPVTPELILGDEGIYFVIASTTQEDGTPSTSKAKFTIDRSPPETGIVATGELFDGQQDNVDQQAIDWPRFVDSADLQVLAHDALSGVVGIEVRLNDGEWEPYSDDVSFKRTLTITDHGDHVIAYRATDLAGNVSEVAVFRFSIVGTGQPVATATPEPAATPIPTPTVRIPTPAPEYAPTLAPVVSASIEAVPNEVNFGEHAIGGRSNPVRITLANVSDLQVQIGDISVDSETPGDFVLENLADCLGDEGDDKPELDPGERCVFSISLSPTETGEIRGELLVEHTGDDEPLTIPISGTGITTFSINTLGPTT